MTVKIKLSQLSIAPEEFAGRVSAFVVAMKEYAGHLEGVKLDAANEALKPEERRVAFPPPSEEPLIERAAADGFEFEGPTLEEKKQALFDQVKKLENEALQAIIPPHKARHWQFEEQDIVAAHTQRLNEFYKSRVGTTTEPHEIPQMSDQDALIVGRADNRRARVASIQRSAARLESKIGDLTEETIDGWTLDVGSILNG